jgi:Protein of unknown function (DUF3828)
MTSFFLRLTLVMAFAAFISQLPGANAAKTPEETIRSFYHWYMGCLIDGGSPMQTKRSEMKQFVTERLLNEIDRWDKETDGLGADPFIQAQDFDNAWKSNIAVSNVKTTGSHATAAVKLKGKDLSRKLTVSLVREQGTWKLDQVKPVD